MFYVAGSAGSRVIKCSQSADSGQTWSAWATAVTPPATSEVRGLAAVGDYLAYAIDPQGTNPDDTLAVATISGGVWQTPSVDTATHTTIQTLGLAREGAYLRLVFYVEGSLELRTRSWHTGTSAWSGGVALLAAGAGSNYSYMFPWLVAPDEDVPRWMLMYREYFNGTPSHSRRMLGCTPDRDYTTETAPVACQGQMQMALLRGGGYWWLIGSREAYRAPVFSGSAGETVDLSKDVAGFVVQEGASGEVGGSRETLTSSGMRPGRLTVRLENADGRFQQVGEEGTAYVALQEGSQLALGIGYRTVEGDEYLWNGPWWVDRLGFEDDGGEGRLRVDCIDPWEYLERFRAHRQEAFANKSLGSVLQRLWWRVCGEASAPDTAGLSAFVPGFTFQPGEVYAEIVRRICRRCGVALRFGLDQNEPTGLTSVQPEAVEIGEGIAEYGYGPAGHPIITGAYWSGGQQANHMELYGSGSFGEAIDEAHQTAYGRDIVRKVVDKEADSDDNAASVAAYLLRWEQIAAAGGWIEVWANPGQQVWDVVAVTEDRANLDDTLRRVLGVRTWFDRKRGQLSQRLWLAGR
jgi:hypothetical protein